MSSMPYSDAYFNPSPGFKQTWSLVPQVRTLSVPGHRTKSMYSALSPAIPLYYILALLAIGFDIYLGFQILAKQGVSLGLIIGSVFADFILAIAPFLFENIRSGKYNHVKLENLIFLKTLQCKTMKKSETKDEFDERRIQTTVGDLKNYKKDKSASNMLRIVVIILILLIAGWKIYTFLKVLPPGISIF